MLDAGRPADNLWRPADTQFDQVPSVGRCPRKQQQTQISGQAWVVNTLRISRASGHIRSNDEGEES